MRTSDSVSIRTLAFVDPLGTSGSVRSGELEATLDRTVRDLLPEHDGLEIEKSGRFLCLFQRPVDAVVFCLACHDALQEAGIPVRAVVHLGEVGLRDNPPEHVKRGAKPLEVEGPARHTAARVLSLAVAGQTLLTRAAFELARRALVGEHADADASNLTWLVHGDYRFDGPDEIVEVFEVGKPGIAPLTPPKAREEIRRAAALSEPGGGWRPAPGRDVPGRSHWLLERRLEDEEAEAATIQVWIARHAKTRERRRVYVGHTEADRLYLEGLVEALSTLQRELGVRDDLPRPVEWSLDEPPYRVETPWSGAPTLAAWAAATEGLSEASPSARLELAAALAETMAAVHGVGATVGELSARRLRVIERKPGARALEIVEGGKFRRVSEESRVQTADDVHELGVWVYRLVAGDLRLPWMPFWERDLEDELLREDVAAATDREPERRISAAELARRLRTLDDRRAEREARLRSRERERLRRFRRRRWAMAALGLLALLALGWALVG